MNPITNQFKKKNQYEPMKKSLLLQEPNHEKEKKNHQRSRKIKTSEDVGVEEKKWRKMKEDGSVRKKDGLGEWMREAKGGVK